MENLQNVIITVSLHPEDLLTVQKEGLEMPPFWTGHLIPPVVGDALRFGRYQCAVTARVWEHDDTLPTLRLYVTRLEPRSDAAFH